MIVMKFGGASLASAAAVRRVASIVQSQAPRHPIVVVSAAGDTTDQLLKILDHAARAESYLAGKLFQDVRAFHFALAEDLLGKKHLEAVDQYIRVAFRDLHLRIVDVCDGERNVTPALRDWVASLGEKLSSRIVTAALQAGGLDALHMDATKLILTDATFTDAKPRYWETYARIRWTIPHAARRHIVVLGGFIGACEDGRTTTLGRGGSDLTATLVGAAVNAEEIQVWKDVDGMLTWDPKLKNGGCRVKSLSYAEASALAQAGATILHPETIAPAQRLRIPVVIRNTFQPDGEGTRIGIPAAACANPVKSIACRSNMTVVELRSPTDERNLAEYSLTVERACRQNKAAELLAASSEVIYLAFKNDGRDPGASFPSHQCVQVRVRSAQAILTLVGLPSKGSTIVERLATALAQRSALILPQDSEACFVRVAVPQAELGACIEILQKTFFGNLDPAFFEKPGNLALDKQAPRKGEKERAEKGLVEKEQPVSLPLHQFALRGFQP
jgi:aspartate kinase